MLEHLATGFVLVSQWQNLLAIVAGAGVGDFVGALPGLSAGMGIALLLPFGFFIPEPVAGQLYPQTNDVDVDERGLIYIVDRQMGFDVLEYLG